MGIDGQQFFKKAADHAGPVDEVYFQYLVTCHPTLIRLTKPQIIAMADGEALRVGAGNLVGKLPD
jgi:hypothetical protein